MKLRWMSVVLLAMGLALQATQGTAQGVIPTTPEVGNAVRNLLALDVSNRGQLDANRLLQISRPLADSGAGDTAAGVPSLAALDAMPAPTGGADWKCLTEALYFEARGETILGQFAVAEVIVNRVDSKRFPNTVCKVINQGTGRKHQCQFSYRCDGRSESIANARAWTRVGKVARLMLDGAPRNLVGGATYYHTTAVRPYWSKKFQRTAQHGVHLFYRQS